MNGMPDRFCKHAKSVLHFRKQTDEGEEMINDMAKAFLHEAAKDIASFDDVYNVAASFDPKVLNIQNHIKHHLDQQSASNQVRQKSDNKSNISPIRTATCFSASRGLINNEGG